MGLDYVLKGPSDYLQKVKRRCGVTQKKPFSWFEIVGLVVRIFLQLSFSSTQMQHVFYFHWKVACSEGFFQRVYKWQIV